MEPREKGLMDAARETVISRIEKNKRVTESGCWEWMGARNKTNYGYTAMLGFQFRVHRVAYEVLVGPIPAGMLVLHRCDNPPCCNPEHLFLGTSQDNMTDKMTKGRHKTWRALSEEQVREIRASKQGPAYLGRKYGVNRDTIAKVRTGRSYAHIPFD